MCAFLRSRFSHGRRERSLGGCTALPQTVRRPFAPRCYTRKVRGFASSDPHAGRRGHERRGMNESRGRSDNGRPLARGEGRRVVVTGMGAVSPSGIGLRCFGEAVRAGRSGAGAIRSFDPTPFATRIGGEITDFDPAAVLTDPHDLRHVPRASVLLLAASGGALPTPLAPPPPPPLFSWPLRTRPSRPPGSPPPRFRSKRGGA